MEAMENDARDQQKPTDDLWDMLSDAWHIDAAANNPRAQEFLNAGTELLQHGLARDADDPPNVKRWRFRAPFDELLAWVSRRRVVEHAARTWGPGSKSDSRPTEAAFRYRWRTQTSYLRDLAIYALTARTERPQQAKKAAEVLFTKNGRLAKPLDQAINEIAYDEVQDLKGDKSFRLQMVFQAILSHDERIADALRLVDRTNVNTWKDLYEFALNILDLQLRPDVTLDDFAYALQAAGEGVVFRALLPAGSDCPDSALPLDHKTRTSPLLALIATGLIVAFVDPGDGKKLRDIARELTAPAIQDKVVDPTPDIDTLNQKTAHLEQQVIDLRQQLKERDEELAAARAANRELMARLNTNT
jgi:hypothetical protein